MSDSGPFLVLHIGKTGGTALKGGYIAENYAPDEVLIDLSTNEQMEAACKLLDGMTPEQRNNLKFVHGHLLKSVAGYFEGGRLITVIRRPESHVVSQYFHKKYATLEQGQPHNLELNEEGLGIIEAADRFNMFNSQTVGIARFFDIDPQSISVEDIPDLLDRFLLVGLTEKLQAFVYYLHKAYGCILAPVEQRNSRSELVNQFIPQRVIKEIQKRSALDIALYEEAERRFDTLFEGILTTLPDEDHEWNAFREMVQDVHAMRLNENAELLQKFEVMNKEVANVIAQIHAANALVAQKDQELQQLRVMLKRKAGL